MRAIHAPSVRHRDMNKREAKEKHYFLSPSPQTGKIEMKLFERSRSSKTQIERKMLQIMTATAATATATKLCHRQCPFQIVRFFSSSILFAFPRGEKKNSKQKQKIEKIETFLCVRHGGARRFNLNNREASRPKQPTKWK